jgi:hypothetical protein
MRTTLFLSLALAFGCAAPTVIEGVWRNPDSPRQHFNRFAVMSTNRDPLLRQTVSSAMIQALRQKGADAVQGAEVLPAGLYDAAPGAEAGAAPNSAAIRESLKKSRCDGALVLSFLERKTAKVWVPGETYLARRDMWDPFDHYWYSIYETVNTPGRFEDHSEIVLESALFDTATGQLVWKVRSRTFNPSGIREASQSRAQAVAEAMQNEGFIPPSR